MPVTKTITIEIADVIASDVVDAYVHQFEYRTEIDGSPNPETEGQFAMRMFTEQAQANIRSTYKSYMTGIGAQAAMIQADEDSLNITVE